MNRESKTLELLYGADATNEQKRRYATALEAFTERFGSGPVRFFRAPGRVNLIGEHTDYNHGYVLPVALDRDVLLLVRQTDNETIHLSNIEPSFPDVSFRIADQILPAPAGDWSNYARGVAQELTRWSGRPLKGFQGLVSSDPHFGVPRGSGLSSSSALTVAVAVALATINDRDISLEQMVRLCSDGEWYVGTRGGIMDQCIALLGEEGKALFLDCRPAENGGGYRYQNLPLPEDYVIFLIDSGVHHRNVSNEFNQRVAACRAGVSLLRRDGSGITHLRDVETVPWEDLEPRLPRSTTLSALTEAGHELGDIPNVDPGAQLRVRACCRHVWSENQRVLSTVRALSEGDISRVGKYLDAAHTSARDDYRISTPELDAIVATALSIEGCAGARLTGAGWGGCVVALVDSNQAGLVQDEIEGSFRSQFARTPHIIRCRAGQGACEVLPDLGLAHSCGDIE